MTKVICSIYFGDNMSKVPKLKKCRDCGYEPGHKTTTSSCGQCINGLLRVIRGR